MFLQKNVIPYKYERFRMDFRIRRNFLNFWKNKTNSNKIKNEFTQCETSGCDGPLTDDGIQCDRVTCGMFERF